MNAHTKFWLVIVILTLTALAVMIPGSQPTHAAGPWYVAPGGNDSNTCLSPAAACATINGALNKPSFAAGDTIRVAIGMYTSAGNEMVLLNKSAAVEHTTVFSFIPPQGTEVVLVNKSAMVSGGWDATFTTQSGMSTIDGEGVRRGITVNSGVTTTVERFTIQNCLNNSIIGGGGGISNGGNLTVLSSAIISNTASYSAPGIANGGGIANSGTLTLTNSIISRNVGDIGGGGIYNGGIAIIINSTISGNTAGKSGFSGGHIGSGVENHGTVVLNNSTISGNMILGNFPFSGGGIDNGGTVNLQNTIIANNSSSDCANSQLDKGTINSLGYNLVRNNLNCTLAASDLTNVDPLLFPLIGSPGYHPLLSGSPAINTGNPAGCRDYLGNLLSTDQRGVARVGRCDIGAYEFDPNNNPLKQVLLPTIFRDYCSDFFDDFSNPASGWPVGEDSLVRFEYLNGEYRVLSKKAGYFYYFGAPTCDRQNYIVEADARWVGAPGESYGLIFGIVGDFDQLYIFGVNTDFRDYELLRQNADGSYTQMVPVTSSSAINPGTTSNHLKVTRNGSQITLVANGTVLGTWSDSAIMGLTGMGLVSSPYNNKPTSDARFDNFSVTSLSGSSVATHRLGEATEGEPPNARHVIVPAPGVMRMGTRPTWR